MFMNCRLLIYGTSSTRKGSVKTSQRFCTYRMTAPMPGVRLDAIL